MVTHDDFDERLAKLSLLEEEIRANLLQYNQEALKLGHDNRLGLISGYEGASLKEVSIFTPKTFFNLEVELNDGWYSSGCSFF